MPLWLRLLTLITFACAVAGLLSPLTAAGSSLAAMAAPDMVPGILFFVIAIAVCVMTWRRSPGGAFLMLILQLTQVVSISGAGGRALVARCGPVLEFTIAPGGYRIGGGLQALFADLSSSSGLTLMTTYSTISESLLEIATLVVGINVLPLYMAWQIWVYLGQVVEAPSEMRTT